MNSRLLGAGAALALAACGAHDAPKGRQSAAEVASTMHDVRLRSGQWEATFEIVSADAAGMPPEALKMMKSHKTTTRSCITPEQAARPDAKFMAGQKDSHCAYSDWSMSGGRMRGTMTCGGKGEGRMTMTMDGSYASDSYDVSSQMSSTGMPGGMSMNMKTHAIGRRIGECPPGGDT